MVNTFQTSDGEQVEVLTVSDFVDVNDPKYKMLRDCMQQLLTPQQYDRPGAINDITLRLNGGSSITSHNPDDLILANSTLGHSLTDLEDSLCDYIEKQRHELCKCVA